MNDTSSVHALSTSEDSIASYLTEVPEFFERHAEVLTGVRLTSVHGHRAVSLQERQAEMLREKIKGLEQRIMEMMRNSSENATIAQKIHRWSCDLASCVEARELPHAITEGLRRIFDVPEAAIRVWDVAPPFSGALYTMGVSSDVKAFASSLTLPFCGPNLGFEPTNWLAKPDGVQSLALLPLRPGALAMPSPAFGMLVLGSPDPLRFDATMGTEFLMRIAEQASAALARLRPAPRTLASV
ncbi:DUF484 family protein [Comamonas endophytica]|uniref:DUF484 family protein n=1 Tax=Comamonas endophytica TaxID=2949090 RepID=A0ABY6G6B6_9BURK|nr:MULTISPECIES: DUF484 family protein [unclassified Acidovorax]MCD2511146.1 DUF484 family protein [Acidovorax sp. D4N7]UYG50549.1 DUF484 family protein [Acidovorax sp. 5MLIR]